MTTQNEFSPCKCQHCGGNMAPMERRVFTWSVNVVGLFLCWAFVVLFALLVIGALVVIPGAPPIIQEQGGNAVAYGTVGMLPFLTVGLVLSQRRRCRVCQICGTYVDVAEGVGRI